MAEEGLITHQTPGDLIPRPDPTTLTANAVNQAKTDLRNELAIQREILEAQLSAVKDAIGERLDAADAANLLRLKAFDRIPADVNERIGHLKELHNERFASIALQFKERDERSAQLAKTQDEALKAALQAARELNSAQGEANKEANAKTEVSFSQQIKAIEDKVEVINGRLNRGEGSAAGSAEHRSEARLNLGQVMAGVAVLIALVSLILYVTKK